MTGPGNVRVPAGEFLAWRIETVSNKIISAGTGSATQFKCTYWYAPSARRTVKMTLRIDTPVFAGQADETYDMLAHEAAK